MHDEGQQTYKFKSAEIFWVNFVSPLENDPKRVAYGSAGDVFMRLDQGGVHAAEILFWQIIHVGAR